MAQFSIDTLNKTDRDNAMVALHFIAISNGEDPLFCPINVHKEQTSKLNEINSEFQKCKEELNLYKDEYSKQTEKIRNLTEENQSLKEKNEILIKEINELNEKLSGFIPGYGGEGKEIFFKPSEEKLEITTIQATGFFVGASIGENIFEFQFNEAKGPHLRAIQSQSETLLPFCDIKYNAPDGNSVKNLHKGTFSLINGEFKIIEKAEISIVKQ